MKNKIFTKFLLAFLVFNIAFLFSENLNGQNFVQLGEKINGNSHNEWFGSSPSLSADGTRIAIGANMNGNNGRDSGVVRIFDWNGLSWEQVGTDINGDVAYDESGRAVSLSKDGKRVAVGSPYSDVGGNKSGKVKVYEFIENDWQQIGQDINGKEPNEWSGQSVSLSSDGRHLAVGSPYISIGDDSAVGKVRMYELINNTWQQMGLALVGAGHYAWLGWTVALSSNGTRVAISSRYYDYTKVFDWNGDNWEQVGDNIGLHFNSGTISISANGNRIIIGRQGSNGSAKVYDWNGNNWVQVGQTLEGKNSGDRFGIYTTVSGNGNRIAIGSVKTNGEYIGYASIYDWNGTEWIQIGDDFQGIEGDNSACQVNLSANGKIFAIGRTFSNTINGIKSGHVSIYEDMCLPPESYPILMFEYATTLTSSSGLYTYNIDLCGEIPYKNFSIIASNGFAVIQQSPSENSNCQRLQITYTNGTHWQVIATLEGSNKEDCNYERKILDSSNLNGTPLLIIDNFDVNKETCPGDSDGSATANVTGGNTSCGEYSFHWTGPNGFTSTENPIINIPSGTYNLSIADCAGTIITDQVYVGRNNSGSGRGRGRRGCKTSLQNLIIDFEVQPNPANNFVKIYFGANETSKLFNIKLIDLAGRTLQQINLEGDGMVSLDVSEFPNGLYIVQLQASNQVIRQEKIMIVK